MKHRVRLAVIAVALGLGASDIRSAGDEPRDVRFQLRVRESAGLRRFGYPVHTRLPEGAPGPSYRLLRDGKTVPAQFRRVEGEGDSPGIALDFNVNLGPLESLDFVVEAGPDVSPGPEPKAGMTVDVQDGAFRVANGASLAYLVPESLDGLFRSVQNVRLEFWKPGRHGLFVKPADGPLTRIGDGGRLRGIVSRSGPFAVGLRFEGEVPAGEAGGLGTTVEMTFPNSKSWAEVRWTIRDPDGKVAGMFADMGLKVELEPTLVDLGANNTVYGFLRGQERMTLEAGAGVSEQPNGWLIRKGPPSSLQAFAKARERSPAPPEGWAHVIDALRCTAVAVDRFGAIDGARDSIEVAATGEVVVGRVYPVAGPQGPTKTLLFWLHFVNNPVQIGAVTSPQAMQSPLHTEWTPLPSTP